LAIALWIDWDGIWVEAREHAPVHPIGTFRRWLTAGPDRDT
jgi:hypothetical protein